MGTLGAGGGARLHPAGTPQPIWGEARLMQGVGAFPLALALCRGDQLLLDMEVCCLNAAGTNQFTAMLCHNSCAWTGDVGE